MEALDNAARHAPGSAVRISLAGDRGQITFMVTDDGPGFDPAAVPAGSGLRNMSDRLAALGGSCQIDSGPGRGTTVAGRVGFADAPAGPAGAVPLAGQAAPSTFPAGMTSAADRPRRWASFAPSNTRMPGGRLGQ